MMMPQPRHPKQRPPSKQQPHQHPNAAPARQHLTTEQRPKTAPSVRTPMAFNCPGNKRGQQHLKQQPKTAPDRHAPSTRRQSRKIASTTSPAPQTAPPQKPKLHAAITSPAPQTTPQSSTCTSTTMPPTTPAPQTTCPLSPGRQARKTASTSTPNCKPAPGRQSPRPASSSQNNTSLAPQIACPLAPGHHSRKTAPPPTPQTACPPSTRLSISQSGTSTSSPS